MSSDFVKTMKIVSILAHTFAPLSVVGSLWNIRDVLRKKERRQSVYHRLVLGNSMGELLVGIWLSLSSLPMPKGSFYGAKGNQATCDAQGFFLQLSVMSPLYTACITLYYLLMTRYSYSKVELLKLERWAHPIIWMFGIATAVAGVPLKLYNPKGTWCWIASLPRMCEDYPDIECLRGDQAKYYLIGFAFGWIWLAVFVTIGSLMMLYFTVYQSEKAMSKYNFAQQVQEKKSENANPKTAADLFATRRRSSMGQSRILRKRGSSRHIASLAAGYVVAFLITMVPVTICITLFPKVAVIGPRAGLSIISVTFSLQGFFTFLVYHRPAIEFYFEKKRRKRVAKQMRKMRSGTNGENKGRRSSLISWMKKRLSSGDLTASASSSLCDACRHPSPVEAPLFTDEIGSREGIQRDKAEIEEPPEPSSEV